METLEERVRIIFGEAETRFGRQPDPAHAAGDERGGGCEDDERA